MGQGRASDNGNLDSGSERAKSKQDDSVRQSLLGDGGAGFTRADSPAGEPQLHTGRARYGVQEGVPGLNAAPMQVAEAPGVNTGRATYGVQGEIPGLNALPVNAAENPGLNTGRATYRVQEGIPGLTALPAANSESTAGQPAETPRPIVAGATPEAQTRADSKYPEVPPGKISAEEARDKTREHIDSYAKFQPTYYGNRIIGGLTGMMAGVGLPRRLDQFVDWYLKAYPAAPAQANGALNGDYNQPRAANSPPAGAAPAKAPIQIPNDFSKRTYESGVRGWMKWTKDEFGYDCKLQDLRQSRGAVQSTIQTIRDDLAIQTKAVNAKIDDAIEMLLQPAEKEIFGRAKFLSGKLSIDDAERIILEGGKKLTGEKALITLDDVKLVGQRNNFMSDPVNASLAEQKIDKILSEWDDLKIVQRAVDQAKATVPQTPMQRKLLGRSQFLDHINQNPMLQLTADEMAAIKAGKPLLPGLADNMGINELKALQAKLKMDTDTFTWKMNKSGITAEDLRVMSERQRFSDLVKNYRGPKVGTLTELGVHFARGWAAVSGAEAINDLVDRKFFAGGMGPHEKPSWHTDMFVAPMAYSLPLFRSFGPNALAASGIYVAGHIAGKQLDAWLPPPQSSPEWSKAFKPAGSDSILMAAAAAWPMKSWQWRVAALGAAYAIPKVYRYMYEGDSVKTMDEKVNNLWDKDRLERSGETLTQSVEQLKLMGDKSAHGLRALTEYEMKLVRDPKVHYTDQLEGFRRSAGILTAGGEHFLSHGFRVGGGQGGKVPSWTEPVEALTYLVTNDPSKEKDAYILSDKKLDLGGLALEKLVLAKLQTERAISEVERLRNANPDAAHNGTPVRAEEKAELDALSERIKCGIEQSRDNEHDINGAFVELQKYAFSIGQDTYYKKLHASITKEAERWERSTRSFVTPECKAKLWRDRCLVEAAFIGSKINYLGVDQKSNIVDPVAVRDNMIKCRASLNKALGHVANHPDNVQLQVIVDDLEKHLAKKLGAFQQEDRYNIVNGNNAQPWK